MTRVVAGLLYLAMMTALLVMVIVSWWWAMFHGWEVNLFVPIKFNGWNEHWLEGAILHLTLLYTPFAWWWVFGKLHASHTRSR